MKGRKETMKQTIILLAMVILGIAIATMILTFRGTTEDITKATQANMESVLTWE
jgi:hypothetical protein